MSAQALAAADKFAKSADPIPASKRTVKARAEEVRAESKKRAGELKKVVARNKDVKKRPASAPRWSMAGGPAISEFRSKVGGKYSAVTEKMRNKLRPTGCSKCRGRVGCTRSCWLSLGFVE